MSKQEIDTSPASSGRRFTRRQVMTAAAALFAAAVVPVVTRGNLSIAAPAEQVVARAAFDRVSQLLTGHDTLDAVLGERLFQAFVRIHEGFIGNVVTLADFIGAHNLAGEGLQAALDDAKSPVAGLPRLIARGWYVGIVEKGPDAICVAYQSSLAQLAVADHIRPPTYAYGAYGTWANKPA